MKKRCLALVLCLCLLLSGCGAVDVSGYFRALGGSLGGSGEGGGSLREAIERNRVIPFSQMTYTRPDVTELEALLDKTVETAEKGDLEGTIDGINGFYDAYDWFYTACSLADIHYSLDLTDEGWAEEYDYCTRISAQVDGMLEQLYRGLAQSPLRRVLEGEDYFGTGFFDGYQGQSLYSQEFLDLLEEESALCSRYYALSADASYDYSGWEEMAQVLGSLIRNRQKQAASQGYCSYVDFIYDFAYYRDYTPEKARQYLVDIREALSPLYRQLDGRVWDPAGEFASEKSALAGLRSAVKAMGGTAWKAFLLMERGGLYDTSWSANKYDISFEVYLASFEEPFLFMNPSLSRYDCLTLAHEFGHFCNDYASCGSTAGIDVAEVFSQGMEYLYLCYGEAEEDMVRMKLADSLCTYVEQSAYAAFEDRMYSLTDPTPESLRELYAEVAREYGMDTAVYDSRDFVTVTHFYTNPMYIISYVVSNDAAMQLYQMELADPGAGLRRYEEQLDTQEPYFLAFLEEADLEAPFDRVSDVREFFLEQGRVES